MLKSWLVVTCDVAFALTAAIFGIYLANDGLGLFPLPMQVVQFLLNACFVLIPSCLVIATAGAILLEPVRFRRYFKASLAFNLIFGGIWMAVSYSGI